MYTKCLKVINGIANLWIFRGVISSDCLDHLKVTFGLHSLRFSIRIFDLGLDFHVSVLSHGPPFWSHGTTLTYAPSLYSFVPLVTNHKEDILSSSRVILEELGV